MVNATLQAFSATAGLYDKNRSCLIPCFDAFYREAVDLIPAGAQRILDLGAGTGLLAGFVRGRLPGAHLHLIDFSQEMLVQARQRFAGDAKVTFKLADYTVAATLTGSYHAVVSALSIHHLEDAAKQALLRSVHAMLAPGGVFINADQVLGPTPALEARYRAVWLEEVRALGATEQQVSDSLYRQQQDRCATVEDQLVWMREAGFCDMDCWFKQGRFAVLAATRP